MNIVLYGGLGLGALSLMLLVRILLMRSKGLLFQGEIVRYEDTSSSDATGPSIPGPFAVVSFLVPRIGSVQCRVPVSPKQPRQVGGKLWVRYDPRQPQLTRSLDELLMGPFVAGFFGFFMLFSYLLVALGF